MKLRHLNGHAALHALQLPTAPTRMDDMERERSRRTQRLERGGKLISRGAQPTVRTMAESSNPAAPARNRPRLVKMTVDLNWPPEVVAGKSRPTNEGAKQQPRTPAPEPAVPATPEGSQRQKPARQPAARRKAPAAPHKPPVAPSGEESAGNGQSGKRGRKGQPAPASAEGTKKALVLAMLRRPQGATTAELMQETGWQSHSVRGFLSGAITKKMALKVRSSKRADGVRVYSVRG